MLNLNLGYKALTNLYEQDQDLLNVISLNVSDTIFVNTISPYSGTTTSNTGKFSITDVTQSTSSSTGCCTLLGGLGIAKRLGVGEFITAPSIKLTDTSNQIQTGTGSNLTTVNFPASSGAITLTMPNVTSTLATTDTAQSITATKTFTVTQDMTTINRTSGNLTLQTTTSGVIALSSATNMTYTSATTSLASHIFNSSVPSSTEVDMKIVGNSATKTVALQLTRNTTNSTTIASIGTAGNYSTLAVQGDTVLRWENSRKFIGQQFTTNVFTMNSTSFSILNSTASTNTTSGALVVTGGVGIGGALFGTSANFSGLTASQAVVTDVNNTLTSLAYTDANTASALIQRDASGNFSAGTITLATSLLLPTTGGLQTALDYHEVTTHVTKWQGPWAAQQNGSIRIIRTSIGVILDFVEVLASATIATTITAATALPARWRPRNDKTFWFPVQDNATNFNGAIHIASATGAITIYKDITLINFTGAGNTGFKGTATPEYAIS